MHQVYRIVDLLHHVKFAAHLLKFDVQECRSNIANPCDCLECAPCFDDIPMTAEAKAAVEATLDAIMFAISPVDRCGCEVIEQVGFVVPLKPAQATNANGEFLWQQVKCGQVEMEDSNDPNCPGQVPVLTTSAINTVTNEMNRPHFTDLCCDGIDSKNSPFKSRGTSSIRYRGGNGPGIFGGFTGNVDSREFHEKITDLFCCVKEKINIAPVVEIEIVDNGDS